MVAVRVCFCFAKITKTYTQMRLICDAPSVALLFLAPVNSGAFFVENKMFLNLEEYLNETFEPQSEERKSGCVDLFQLDLSVLEKIYTE